MNWFLCVYFIKIFIFLSELEQKVLRQYKLKITLTTYLAINLEGYKYIFIIL